MIKQYRKESLGRTDASLSSEGIFSLPHSPEQEQAMQKLIAQLQPILQQMVQQVINLAIEENWIINQGNIIRYITNYISNYFNTYYTYTGPTYSAGNGIKILGSTIAVRDGNGLEADDGDLNIDLATNPGLQITSSKLEAKPNAAAAMGKDADGLKVVLDDELDDSESTGGGLSFNGGVRVAPLDFLYTSADD